MVLKFDTCKFCWINEFLIMSVSVHCSLCGRSTNSKSYAPLISQLTMFHRNYSVAYINQMFLFQFFTGNSVVSFIVRQPFSFVLTTEHHFSFSHVFKLFTVFVYDSYKTC